MDKANLQGIGMQEFLSIGGGVVLVGVHIKRALLFGVHIRATDFEKLT